ncbi:hypothetical protein BH11BAC2_BH11BAC2_09250 [soil metagenome]
MISALIAVIAGTAFDILSDNGKAGYTGSTGEATCTSCHNSYGASNSGPGSISISSNLINGNQYIPGQTYNVHVIVRQTGRSLFGLGCEALTTTNTNGGTLVITNSAKTHLATKTVSGVSRNNVVHQLNGGAHADSMDFTFNWVAPITNIGNVKFWFSGIAANGNGNENGDYVYNNSLVVTPASATGIEEAINTHALLVNAIAAEHRLQLNFEIQNVGETFIYIYDLNGRQVLKQREENSLIGMKQVDVKLPYAMQSGIYLVTVQSGKEKRTQKISLLF